MGLFLKKRIFEFNNYFTSLDTSLAVAAGESEADRTGALVVHAHSVLLPLTNASGGVCVLLGPISGSYPRRGLQNNQDILLILFCSYRGFSPGRFEPIV